MVVMNVEKLTVKEVCNCLAILNKLREEKIIKFTPKKPAVQFNYHIATLSLEKQNIEQAREIEKLKNIITDIKKLINDGMQYYDDGEDCGVDCCIDGFKVLEIIEKSDDKGE